MLMELTNETKCAKWNNIADDKKHLETLMIFLSQLKTFIQKRPTYKTTIAELFSKTSKKKKISYK